jgi:hypothetical protein
MARVFARATVCTALLGMLATSSAPAHGFGLRTAARVLWRGTSAGSPESPGFLVGFVISVVPKEEA